MRASVLEKMAGEIALSNDPGPTMRKWREAFQVTQAELASRLGVSPSVVSDFESGRRRSPGVATVRRVVEALAAADEARGGHVLARFAAPAESAPGILAIGDYPRSLLATDFVEAIEGQVLVEAGLAGKRVHGYTLLDSIQAIAGLTAADYPRVFGGSTERALLFTGVKYGRSPMIAVRVHPLKPSLVVYHRPDDVDSLAHRLADAERVPLVVTELGLAQLSERLRRLAG